MNQFFEQFPEIEIKVSNLIKKYEGLQLKAYLCPSSIPTIGFGSIYNYAEKRRVKLGDQITLEQAELFLRREIIEKAERVIKLVEVELTENQLAALVSFTYNVGTGAFSKSTMLKLINSRSFEEAANQFSRWIYGNQGGKKIVLNGLKRRREEEKELFLQ